MSDRKMCMISPRLYLRTKPTLRGRAKWPSAVPACQPPRHEGCGARRCPARSIIRSALSCRAGDVKTSYSMTTRRILSGSTHGLPILTAICLAALASTVGLAAAPVQASKGTLTMPTYPWGPAEPHPNFRETDGKNIYPYPMLDNLSREKTNRTYRTVVLEN